MHCSNDPHQLRKLQTRLFSNSLRIDFNSFQVRQIVRFSEACNRRRQLWINFFDAKLTDSFKRFARLRSIRIHDQLQKRHHITNFIRYQTGFRMRSDTANTSARKRFFNDDAVAMISIKHSDILRIATAVNQNRYFVCDPIRLQPVHFRKIVDQ